jgi:hypothetical protein
MIVEAVCHKSSRLFLMSSPTKKPANCRTAAARMRKREAFMHWYGKEGMSTSVFDEAHSSLWDLMNEYAACEHNVSNMVDSEDSHSTRSGSSKNPTGD